MRNKVLTYNEAKEILARHPARQLTYKEAKVILAENDRRHEEFVRRMQATLEAVKPKGKRTSRMRNFLVTVNDHDECGGDYEVPALCLASAWNRAAKQLRHPRPNFHKQTCKSVSRYGQNTK